MTVVLATPHKVGPILIEKSVASNLATLVVYQKYYSVVFGLITQYLYLSTRWSVQSTSLS